MSNDKFEMHCVVELFGHSQIAGKVTEQAIGGASFIRVDVPKTSKREGFTRFFSPSAIYSMTPVDEKIAAIMADRLEIEPVSEWTLQRALQQKLLESPAGQALKRDGDRWEDDWDSSTEGPDDDDPEDAPFFGNMPDDDELDLHAPATPETVERALSTLASDKLAVAVWARALLKGEFVIFDTETTGIEADDEIIQIGIIDQTGAVVLERLIKPSKPITNTAYHGLTDDTVKNAPGFAEVHGQIRLALEGKTLVAYNLEYDLRMLNQDCERHHLDIISFSGHCAMEKYAQFHGEWNDYHGNYRWKKLREALAAFGLKHEDFGTKEHDACTDARATLAVIQKMAEFKAEAKEAAPAATE